MLKRNDRGYLGAGAGGAKPQATVGRPLVCGRPGRPCIQLVHICCSVAIMHMGWLSLAVNNRHKLNTNMLMWNPPKAHTEPSLRFQTGRCRATEETRVCSLCLQRFLFLLFLCFPFPRQALLLLFHAGRADRYQTWTRFIRKVR